jgi:nucleoside-diphosphate-sugar epimerase
MDRPDHPNINTSEGYKNIMPVKYNPRILVVGGAGYIGGIMVDLLIERSYDVTVYDSLVYETRYLKKVPFILGDVRDRKKLKRIVSNYDVVIWLAAIVGDGACAIDPYLTQSINEDSVKWLVDNYKHGKIIFTSTCSVYGASREAVDEESPTNPLSVYAETKLNAEQYIIQNAKDYLILRLGTVFGLGDTYSRIRLDLVVNILTLKATQGEPLTVFGGEQWRPLVHVTDVGEAVEFGIRNRVTNKLYNLSCGNYQISNIAKAIQTVIPATKVSYTEMEFEDMRNYKIKGEGFCRTGWVAGYTLEEGIREIREIVLGGRIKNLKDPVYSNEYYLGEHYQGI